jgi:hypothetical protein
MRRFAHGKHSCAAAPPQHVASLKQPPPCSADADVFEVDEPGAGLGVDAERQRFHGMSPIILDTSPAVPRSLTPKNTLHGALANSDRQLR